MNAGSYVMRPKSSSSVLIWRRSMLRIVPSVIGISYCCPVRLSVTESDAAAAATPPSDTPLLAVSVPMALPECVLGLVPVLPDRPFGPISGS